MLDTSRAVRSWERGLVIWRKGEVARKKARGEEFSYFNLITCTRCQDCPVEIFVLFWGRENVWWQTILLQVAS